jgi:tetratricopeptide (TPR) repeat protein
VDGKEVDNCAAPDPAETDATCDGIDDDCDGATDEDFLVAKSDCGMGACAATGEVTCVAGTSTDTCVAGVAADSTDAICDGLDSDCDGEVDEDFPTEPTTCSNESTCKGAGEKTCVQGQIVDNCAVPAPAKDDATCDGHDDDCDGRVDEDYLPPNITCGAGPCLKQGAATCKEGQVVETCVPAEPEVTTDEQCNGIDDDCDGVVDDDFVGSATRCGTTGACRGEGSMICQGGQIIDSCIAPEPNRVDTSCNGIDDDCDGEIDEDFSPELVSCGQGVCEVTGVTSCPRTRDTRLARALLLTRMGRSADAITEFGKLNPWDLESESVAVAYALALARAGQPRRALAHLQTLLKSTPQSIEGNTQIGELHVERQAYALAEDYLQTALRVAPYHAPAHHALGRIALHRELLPQAIAHFRTALGFDSENIANHISLGAALMDSRGEDQVGEAEQVLDLVILRYGRLQGAAARQREPDVYLRRGRLHHDRGQFPDAMRHYSLSLELDSKNLAALSGAGETLLKLNRVAEGEAMFRRVLKEDSADTRSHYHLGRISHRRGEIAAAEAHLRKATAREEASFADAHKTLGLLHKERKEAIPARAHLRAYLKLSSQIGDEEREEITRIMNRLR